MDGVVSPATAGIVGKLGGLAVLNLEGIWTRYEDADEQLAHIASCRRSATREMQEIYRAGQARADRPAHRGDQGRSGVVCAASLTPQRVEYYEPRSRPGWT